MLHHDWRLFNRVYRLLIINLATGPSARDIEMIFPVILAITCGTRVRWFTDSQNVARILAVGSKIPRLQTEVLAIFLTALANQVRIEPEWIPQNSNQKADYISRIVDYDNWSIDTAIFAQLDARWGLHTVDRFASCYNTQLPHFNCRFWNPASKAVDAFTCDWRDENNWMCLQLTSFQESYGMPANAQQ